MTDPSAIDELLARARGRLNRVRPEQLADEIGNGAILIDIRPSEQRQRDGDLPGAVVVDRNVLEWRLGLPCEHVQLQSLEVTSSSRDVIRRDRRSAHGRRDRDVVDATVDVGCLPVLRARRAPGRGDRRSLPVP